MLAPQNCINTVNFASLEGICYVQNIVNMSLVEKESLVQKMAAYEFVKYAYIEPLKKIKLPL